MAAFREIETEVSDDARDVLVRALEAHRATLYEHLRIEEAAVIPRLLELSRDEFERYGRLPIALLLRASAG